MNRKNFAMIAYTTLSTDSRVVRESLAAKETGFTVDLYVLNEDNKIALNDINIHYTKKKQYKGKNKIKFLLSYFNFFFFCFFKICFSRRYYVIHVNNMPNFLIFSCIFAKILGSKLILDIHDLMPEVYAQKFNLPLRHPIIRFLYLEERLSGNFADVVISTNRLHTKRFIKNKIHKNFFPEILNSADESIFNKTTNRNFFSDEIVVIYPTTIAKHLGIDILIDAMEILKRRDVKVKLKIFGDGEYRETAMKLVNQKELDDYIIFSDGFIDFSSLSEEYNKAHIGVLPYPNGYSTSFQMPIKIHEYFIKGLCTIASDINIIREYFSNCTLLFNAGDPKDLADKIYMLIQNRELMKEYANKGFEYYLKHPWSKYKKRYIDLLNELVNEKDKD